MQTAIIGIDADAWRLSLPPPHEEVLPGIRWGRACVPNTPAFWAAMCRWPIDGGRDFVSTTGSIVEEVAFCLLGGFGIRYEVNAAAFERLRAIGAFDLSTPCDESVIREALMEPLQVGSRRQRYRFPNQRAARLAAMREGVTALPLEGLEGRALRDRLTAIDGVGPKTASWIVRNLTGSDDVAIIDVHVLRACRAMGVFPASVVLPRDYAELEGRFLRFANALDVRASILDAVIWTEMRDTPLH